MGNTKSTTATKTSTTTTTSTSRTPLPDFPCSTGVERLDVADIIAEMNALRSASATTPASTAATMTSYSTTAVTKAVTSSYLTDFPELAAALGALKSAIGEDTFSYSTSSSGRLNVDGVAMACRSLYEQISRPSGRWTPQIAERDVFPVIARALSRLSSHSSGIQQCAEVVSAGVAWKRTEFTKAAVAAGILSPLAEAMRAHKSDSKLLEICLGTFLLIVTFGDAATRSTVRSLDLLSSTRSSNFIGSPADGSAVRSLYDCLSYRAENVVWNPHDLSRFPDSLRAASKGSSALSFAEHCAFLVEAIHHFGSSLFGSASSSSSSSSVAYGTTADSGAGAGVWSSEVLATLLIEGISKHASQSSRAAFWSSVAFTRVLPLISLTQEAETSAANALANALRSHSSSNHPLAELATALALLVRQGSKGVKAKVLEKVTEENLRAYSTSAYTNSRTQAGTACEGLSQALRGYCE